MLIFDRSKFFEHLFTLIKLGVALALLFVLGTKFLDLWQAEAAKMPNLGSQSEVVE